MEGKFDWVALPEGRARFAGSIRGWDELGHHTFAVDMDDDVFSGEIEKRFSGETMFLEVLNFGYPVEVRVGIPDGRRVFSQVDVDRVTRLILGLVEAVDRYPDERKPVTMKPHGARFTGDVEFAEGWIRVSDGR